jgi:sulfur carrier protein
MKLKLNGTEQEYAEDKIKLTELLIKAGVAKPELVSVQLNGNFVNREEFSSTITKNGDEVDFLFFMGGGSSMLKSEE